MFDRDPRDYDSIRIVFPRPLDHAYDAYQTVMKSLNHPCTPQRLASCNRILNSASRPLAENPCIPGQRFCQRRYGTET